MKKSRFFSILVLLTVFFLFAACNDNATTKQLAFSYNIKYSEDNSKATITIVEGDVTGASYTYVIDDGSEAKSVSDLTIVVTENCTVTITGKKDGYTSYKVPVKVGNIKVPTLYFTTQLNDRVTYAEILINDTMGANYSYQVNDGLKTTVTDKKIKVEKNCNVKITASKDTYESYTTTVKVECVYAPVPVLSFAYNSDNTATVSIKTETDVEYYRITDSGSELVSGNTVDVDKNCEVVIEARKTDCKSSKNSVNITGLNESPKVCFYNNQFYVLKVYNADEYSLKVDDKIIGLEVSKDFDNYLVTTVSDFAGGLSSKEIKVICTARGKTTECYFKSINDFETAADLAFDRKSVTLKFTSKSADVRFEIDQFPTVDSEIKSEKIVDSECKVFAMPVYKGTDDLYRYGEVKATVIDSVTWELLDNGSQTEEQLFVEGGKYKLEVPDSLKGKTDVKTGYKRDCFSENDVWAVYYTSTPTDFTTLSDIDDFSVIKNVEDLAFSVKAIWTPITYSIRFSGVAEKATGEMDVQEFKYDKSQNLSANQFVRTGYDFTGWSDGEKTYVDKQSVINLTATDLGEINFLAQWEAKDYTLTCVDGEKTWFVINDMHVEDNYVERAQKQNLLSGKKGYSVTTVTDTLTHEVMTTKTDAGDDTVNIEFTPVKYRITFLSNTDMIKTESVVSGSTEDTIAAYDTKQSLTPNGFVLEGYTFTSWTDENGNKYSDCEEVLNLTDKEEKDGGIVKMYANWKANSYTVKFVSTDGKTTDSDMKDQQMTYDKEASLSKNSLKRTGYTFKEWLCTPTDTTYTDCQIVTNLTSETDGVVTLDAQWSADEYTITLNANAMSGYYGVNGEAKIAYDGTSFMTNPAIIKPTLTGHSEGDIKGYYSDPDCNNMVIKSTFEVVGNVEGYTKDGKWIRTSDTTLYTKWSET